MVLLLRCYPTWDARTAGDLAPNDVDVTPKVIELVRKGEWNANATDSILDAISARMRAVAGVARVDRVADLPRADTASDPVARRWIHHLSPDAGVVLAASLQAGSVWDIPNAPIAMHGQPSNDDSHVPLIFWGRGVKRGIYRGRANTVDIAPTLGRLLNVTPLSLIDGRVQTDALAPRN